MEVYTPSAPIYGVNNDVLLCIFTLNANMFFDRQALHTARATSQVCRQWRDLMLEAPLLWAKLIDMDICDNDGKLDWINEIIRRSGTVAPLWIKAEISSKIIGIGFRSWLYSMTLIPRPGSVSLSRCCAFQHHSWKTLQ
ncbi:hypothetical protein HYPSUDRAFT_38451 [Hypholoma sublateritium FD-334 SS-4]|uniref:Uncharacterized protein n=1 Tax=Hypholoma sublateritium (strain FD-334 SS-4) TaxID=945553 RepID=A0A0D2P1K5_HYPSF|nr:hypothetical protein HYPSUDRAFT_38451 [Hypholoma sublateritium FD-334 SS-4]